MEMITTIEREYGELEITVIFEFCWSELDIVSIFDDTGREVTLSKTEQQQINAKCLKYAADHLEAQKELFI